MPRHIRLHLRHPIGWARYDEFLSTLRNVFDSYDVGITFETASTFPYADPPLKPIDVGSCEDGPSDEAAALFERLAPLNMDDDEIVVLLPPSLTGPVRWGCAQCPLGRRGVVVSAAGPALVLAHEIAHLFLGPGHNSSTNNLMFADSARVTKVPPDLLPQQLVDLREAVWRIPDETRALQPLAMLRPEPALGMEPVATPMPAKCKATIRKHKTARERARMRRKQAARKTTAKKRNSATARASTGRKRARRTGLRRTPHARPKRPKAAK